MEMPSLLWAKWTVCYSHFSLEEYMGTGHYKVAIVTEGSHVL